VQLQVVLSLLRQKQRVLLLLPLSPLLLSFRLLLLLVL
jgi:hypothetical protein